MADVKWIKINVDIFDDEKFSIIDSMPEADAIEVMWFKLLVFAGRSNNDGIFFFNDRIAYTDEMLASVFRRPLNTVRLALNTFMNLGMIEEIDGVYTILNWGKYQTLDAYEKKKERDREYQRIRREKQKQEIEDKKSSDNRLTVGRDCSYSNSNSLYISDSKKKNKEKIDINTLYESYNITGSLREAVDNWLAYKRERNFTYKEIGLKALLNRIKNNSSECGDKAVIDVIELSISNGYQGIVWNRMTKGGAKSGRTGADDRAVEEDPYAKRFRDAARGCLSDMSEHGVENLFD